MTFKNNTLCSIAKYEFHPFLLVCFLLLFSCAGTYNPALKIAPGKLQQDFDMVWETYQQVHPSYDWYAPQSLINQRFAAAREAIKDSMTEPEFRLQLAYAVSGINCGHTSVRSSKAFTRHNKNFRGPVFPLDLTVLQGDSLVVTHNRLGDSGVLKRGDIVLMINNVPAKKLVTQMRNYISSDGYNNTFKDDIISRSFASRFKWLYGLQPHYEIGYLDSSGQQQQAKLTNYIPRIDTSKPNKNKPSTARKGKKGKTKPWSLSYDTGRQFAFIELKSFSGAGFRRFTKKAFKKIKQDSIASLVIDISENGGGAIGNYTNLSQYLAEKPFTIADSISAVSLKFPYRTRMQAWGFYSVFGWMLAHRQSDGRLHMRSSERTLHRPTNKFHFDGPLYVLTGGFSFSASTLFLNTMRQRKNVTTIGVETGGGARGNSAVLVPELHLPNSKVSVRVPLFRLVTDHTLPHNGRGIFPTISTPKTSHSIRHRYNPSFEMAKKLIAESAPQQ